MITIQDLTIENLRSIGGSNFRIRQGNLNRGVETYGYRIAQNQDIQLHYVMNIQATTLESGAEIRNADGYLISQRSPNGNYQIGLAFFNTSGTTYSTISDSLKFQVVEAYNQTIQGDFVQTSESVDEYEPSRNEQGETAQEQRAREEQEAQEQAGQAVNEPFYLEPAIVYDETLSHRFPNPYRNQSTIAGRSYGENITSQRYVVVKAGRGTISNPILDFNLYQVQIDKELGNEQYLIQSRFVEWTDSQNPYSTLEQAVQTAQNRFNDYVQSLETGIQEEYREQYESETIIEESDEFEVYWKQTNLSFRDMTSRDDLEYSETAFRKGREGEERVGGSIYTGDYNDAVKWTNNGNTLELVDFDTPRVTTRGITRNTSGGIAFTVKQGWKVKFTLKTNAIVFTQKSQEELEGSPITLEGNTFVFDMIGGDRLEIDIDNERDGVYPFLVTSNGYVWESNVEIDDEVFLTMNKAEQLYYKFIKTVKEVYANPPRQGEIKSQNDEIISEGRIVYIEGIIPNLDAVETGRVNALLTDYQKEALTYTRTFGIIDVKAESSFTTVDDILPDLPDLPNVVPDNWQVWVIGGVLAVGAFILLAVFINARARGGGE